VAVDPQLAEYVKQVLTEILFSSEEDHPLKETLDRYFTPDYEQESDGKVYDRETFAAYVRKEFREPTEHATITVHEIIREGNRAAQRHRFDITTRDGGTARMEVHMFLEYAGDGRLYRVHEMTRRTVTSFS
jgi:ketosteroid isomerase-like protein